MKNAFLFFAIAFAHFIAHFLTWSYAEYSGLAHAIWSVLATPLLLMAGSLSNEYFWPIAIANSFLWSALMLWVARRFLVRSRA